ncbi:putative transcription factor OFP family [Helianthus annuus]|uniref:Transcription repressor n=1 Tax=Helianthus annuus TaxID=4232 RepID=A0A251U6F6_HELAN|nr:transcription repressor OFP1 [Helianthus annuus]KAF5795858.1 putative transcription factor OFP family [Helianthus annuus]KAJ0539306.1 putative transcription factor OFP family [Helianthus annuus]KAJ0547417.1 putative transcription factor OFP family [Helianthus annuus]KAJ0553966.1 putative transcription factor OFP family [Helianthus annuus]KAJ0719607.1 putative transcription factor OFP family [Helianthus annuus]
MGNYRFRLSDMLPNAWFYKLRDMSKTKTTTTTTNHHKKPPSYGYYYSSTTTAPPQNHHFSHPRNSFYYTPKVSQFHNSPKSPHFHDPPRKSSKKLTPNRKTIYKPSPKRTSLTESTHTLQDFFHSPLTNQSPSSESTQSGLTSCTCRLSSSTSDIIIDVNEPRKIDFSPEKDLKLPPIITKPSKPTSRTRKPPVSSKKVKENNQTPARKSVSGLKLRSNSPKLALNKRIVQKSTQRKNMPESFAIVKSSFDPQKDFMESMMEMIVENNIRASKDLEELLACYLSLNSDEYHDVIVKAFEQIWFSLPDL